MKTQIKAKFLRYILNKKQEEQGFTLIELLVVIIIIGILSAIALPSFLNQANKAKQSEGKTYVGSMNRAQQTYYLENGKFATNVDNLGIGIKTKTQNYEYTIKDKSGIAGVANNGISQTEALKSYAGVVILSKQDSASEGTTLAILCESNSIGKGTAQEPDTASTPTTPSSSAQPKCPATYGELNKSL